MERAINQFAVELIDRMGGQAAVAAAAGVSRQAAFKWKWHGIPPDRVDALKAAFPKAGWVKLGKAVGRGRGAR